MIRRLLTQIVAGGAVCVGATVIVRYGDTVNVGGRHAGAVHVHGHCSEHFLIYLIELLHVAGHFFGFLAVAGALICRFRVHVTYVFDTAVDAVD